VPLPHQAVTIISRLREKSPDSRYYSCEHKDRVISENHALWPLPMGYHSRQTTHGLRRCASTIDESGKFEPDGLRRSLRTR